MGALGRFWAKCSLGRKEPKRPSCPEAKSGLPGGYAARAASHRLEVVLGHASQMSGRRRASLCPCRPGGRCFSLRPLAQSRVGIAPFPLSEWHRSNRPCTATQSHRACPAGTIVHILARAFSGTKRTRGWPVREATWAKARAVLPAEATTRVG